MHVDFSRRWKRLFTLFTFALASLISGSVFSQPFPIGHRSMVFIDAARNNRQVTAEVYYPAQTAGNNTTVENGTFPIIIFGHGFVMPYSAYGYFRDAMAPLGYFVVFPTTEGGFSPSHAEYGFDLAFLVEQMIREGNNSSSPFYQHVDSASAIMGHSMGGGASFLACKNNTLPTVMVTLAAAETNPSAIAAAPLITIPNLVFAADEDCVTPPSTNQTPMYNALASDCKVFINIKGGGHCYFGDYNFQCSLGELGCQQNFTISREQQQDVTLDFTVLYLDYYLKGNASSWTALNDSLLASQRVGVEKLCVTTSNERIKRDGFIRIYPNPSIGKTFIDITEREEEPTDIIIRSLDGQVVLKKSGDFADRKKVSIDVSNLQEGFYILEVKGSSFSFHKILIKSKD